MELGDRWWDPGSCVSLGMEMGLRVGVGVDISM